MIFVTINGQARELERETALPDLLRSLGVDPRLVAAGLNGEVIPKNRYSGIVIRDGDVLEVVRMVGGGAPPPAPAAAQRGGAEVVIAGAGIIGSAIAYELSRRGVSCLLLDSRRVGMAATNAAAGILAPLAEFQRPGPLVPLGLASLRLYPDWVERLREEAPEVDVEFALNGVLRVAFDEEEMAELRAGLRFRDGLGPDLVELDGDIVREVEPRLS